MTSPTDGAARAASMMRIIRWLAYAGLGAIGLAWAGLWLARECGLWPASHVVAPEMIGGPFQLIAGDGRAVSDADYRGRWRLMFFGYTHCPDVCPMAMTEISLALDALGPLAARVQPLFVSVDPGRDTPAVLRDFFHALDPRIEGLTGTPEQIAAAARAFRVFYRRVGDGPDYTIDHSAVIYALDPDGTFAAHFTHETPGARMAERLRGLIAARRPS